jgi:outer membrane biosynthesis protein TonB
VEQSSVAEEPTAVSNAGPIAGGVVGGTAAAAGFVLLGFFFWRRRAKKPAKSDNETAPVDPVPEYEPVPPTVEAADKPKKRSQPPKEAEMVRQLIFVLQIALTQSWVTAGVHFD